MKNRPKITALALACWAGTASCAHALSLGDGAVQISGFGTLGVVHTGYKDADFVANSFEVSGAGHTRSVAANVDSKLGAQLDADLGRGFAAVVQVVSRQNAHGNFKPAIEWANLSYEAASNLTLRVGRTVLPTYMRADSQYVGYTLPFVRIPGEIGYANPVTNSDGLDVSYRVQSGGVKHNLQVMAGRSHGRIAISTFEASKLLAAFDTMEWGENSARVGYSTSTYRLPGLPKSDLNIFSLGLMRETDRYFVSLDTQHADDAIQGKINSWYANAGLRFGEISPYVTYARTRIRFSPDLGADVNSGSQTTVGMGVRWNFAANMAFKLQFDQIRNRNLVSPTSFTRIQPTATSGDQINLVSMVVDFIF